MSDLKTASLFGKVSLPQSIQKTVVKTNEEKKLEQACKDFESVFVEMLFKSMRATVPDSGLLNNEHEQTFRDMLDEEYSKEISNSGNMGIAAALYRQLSKNIKSDK